MRLIILGGGGFRVPLVHRALLADTVRGDAPVSEVVLFDRDPARLRAIGAVLDRQRDAHRAAHGEPELTVRTETDLATALDGADIVFSAIRVGGMAGRVLDERVALAAGVLGQETVGAGGISYGLRTVPVVERVARTVAERAPGAWVVNFTNPAGLVTEAMSAVLGDRVVGICDSPVGLGRRAARALGLDPREVSFDYAGLNHLGWLRGLHTGGRDRLPDLLADDTALASFEEGRLFGAPWLRALGALPNEYLHYYYMAREARDAITDTVAGGGPTRGEQITAQQREFYRDAAGRPADAFHLWDRTRLAREETYMADNRRAAGGVERAEEDLDGGGYEQVALAVMRAVARDEPARLIVNVRNRGSIAGLDDDAVVEVPCLVDGSGARPLAVGALTGHQAALVQAVKAVEREVLAAVRSGSRTPALRAFALHPLVDSVTTARTLLDGYLAAFPELREVLPRP
ncbi:6-phospho-beta-glucosidase [Marinitenerispora sediminis]|uniref:6-phospho-beta-glucosidase n=1 Tax=Marinitenerispora sediminis TaxID=1931232 RepID=A0A368TCN0_9ACTN|nr:6-phospho-beta-glucosidase [Marinitenerispora sediminis]RCV55172.1 6-phospho-beta-glucosidase [Marinitenerispora sediminis]RCV61258.1 6-phospho-beta-glucosidase [Marinitenerispora sediminis]RCV61529.1 6-phospho-beta-glucosidase [Marinitenerispora sediminis]